MIQSKLLAVLGFACVLWAVPVWAQKTTTPAAMKGVSSVSPAAPTRPQSAMPNKPLNAPDSNLEGILASLKTDLKITPAQSKQWDAFATSILEGQKEIRAINVLPPAGSPPNITLDTMEAHRRFMKAKADTLERTIQAFKPLYDTFTGEQKAAADRLIRQRLGMAV